MQGGPSITRAERGTTVVPPSQVCVLYWVVILGVRQMDIFTACAPLPPPSSPTPPDGRLVAAGTARGIPCSRAFRLVAPISACFLSHHPPLAHTTKIWISPSASRTWVWGHPLPSPPRPLADLSCPTALWEGPLPPWAPSAPFFPSHHPLLPHTTQNPDLPLCQQIMGVQAPNPLAPSTPNPSQLAHHARCQSHSALGRIPHCLCVEKGSGSHISHAHFCLTMPFSPPSLSQVLEGESPPAEGIGRKHDYGCRWCGVSFGWCSWWGGMLAK